MVSTGDGDCRFHKCLYSNRTTMTLTEPDNTLHVMRCLPEVSSTNVTDAQRRIDTVKLITHTGRPARPNPTNCIRTTV
jgi:hypothetical protein